jgi:hypothetical protein
MNRLGSDRNGERSLGGKGKRSADGEKNEERQEKRGGVGRERGKY